MSDRRVTVLAEIEATLALFAAAGRRNIPVPLSEWKEMQMAANVKGKVVEKTGKKTFKPTDTRSLPQKIGGRKKADRQEKALRANRAGKSKA